MKQCVWIITALLAVSGFAQVSGPEEGPFGPGQAVADEVRANAATDFAFIPGGVLKNTNPAKDDLSSCVQSTTEKIVVLKLTGKQVWNALERSVSMAPSSNPSFLQISGLRVTYKTNALVDRLTKIELDSGTFSLTASYTVAIPQTMAKGGYGFFTIWDDTAIQKTLTATLGSVTKSKKMTSSDPRYKTVKAEK